MELYKNNKSNYANLHIESKLYLKKGGGDDNVMFILFPGFGNSEKQWDYDYEKNEYSSNFLSTLRNLGKVHLLTYPWDNIIYYRDPAEKHFFGPELQFTKKDLNVEYYCDKIYNQVKDFKGKFVPIGHSIGSHYVYFFCKKYYSKCIFSVVIDGSSLGSFYHPKECGDDIKNVEKYTDKKFTDDYVELMKDKIYDGDKEAMSELRRYCLWNIIAQRDKEKPNLKVRMLQIKVWKTERTSHGYDQSCNQIFMDEIEFWKKHNPKKYNVIIFYEVK